MASGGAPDGGTRSTFQGDRKEPPKYSGDPTKATYFVIKEKDQASEKGVTSLNPFVITKTLKGMVGDVKQVTPNWKNKTILVQANTPAHARNLLKLDKIGEMEVSVEPHAFLNTVKGIVHDRDGIMRSLSEEEIAEGLKDQGVFQVKRFNSFRNGQKSPSNTYLISFHMTTKPDNIKVMYQRLTVKTYYPNPLRCFKCQGYGHHVSRCQREAKCVNCGEEGHEKEDCKNIPHCANCKGPHAANDRDCTTWTDEKEIIRIKVDEGISFPEARKKVLNKTEAKSYKDVVSGSPPTAASLLSDLQTIPLDVKKELVLALMKELKEAKDTSASTPNTPQDQNKQAKTPKAGSANKDTSSNSTTPSTKPVSDSSASGPPRPHSPGEEPENKKFRLDRSRDKTPNSRDTQPDRSRSPIYGPR